MEVKVIGSANVRTSVTMTVIVAIFARSSPQKEGGTPSQETAQKR